MIKLAIIGGTGLNFINGLEGISTQRLKTPYGDPSADFVCGKLNGIDIIFLARHGNPHKIPPHKINYRANIWGLKQLGVSEIISIAAVGGITQNMSPAHIAIPDQIIDYSYDREHTFFVDDLEVVTHIDFTFPYSKQLRNRIIRAADNELSISQTGIYGCTQGPRLESAAEILRMERDGCNLVGMTGMPEASLARELDIDYAAISVVANWAAGKSEGEISMAEIEQHLKIGMADVEKLLKMVVLSY